MMRRPRYLTLPLLLSAGLAATTAPAHEVRRGELVTHLLLTGELVAEQAVQLVAPNVNVWPLQIRTLAEDGREVAAGDPVVDFDNAQLVGDLADRERAVTEARNELGRLRSTVAAERLEASFRLEQSRVALEKARLDSGVPAGLLARKEEDERRLALERAELEVAEAERALRLKEESAKARTARQRLALDRAELRLGQVRNRVEVLTIAAPRAGVLLVSENPQVGRPYESGDSAYPGRTIARIPDLSSLLVEAQLFDVDDGQIEVGMPVRAVVDAFPELELAGEVVAIDHLAAETSRFSTRRSFRTRIRVDGLDRETMRPGMSVKVLVERRYREVLTLPRRLLRWPGVGGSARPRVRLADGSEREIFLGPCGREACVVESGLAEGDRLRPAGDGGSQ